MRNILFKKSLGLLRERSKNLEKALKKKKVPKHHNQNSYCTTLFTTNWTDKFFFSVSIVENVNKIDIAINVF